MKKWTPVEVIWEDAHGGDVGWEPEADAKDTHEPSKIRTVGMMVRSNRHGIAVVMSRDTDAKRTGGYLFIPRSNVVSVTELG